MDVSSDVFASELHVLALAVDVMAVAVDGTFDAAAVDQVVHAVEAAQQGRLAEAGRADEGGHALRGYVHADVEQCLLLPVIEATTGHFDRSGECREGKELVRSGRTRGCTKH